ncbi:S8 family peptidase [Limnobaculum zhutongyuii]|uniref:S8 family peptidase n=1 Tax=Limnobaculum zhutongyuii TaxID=2498113 RepID=A0A411WM86_9GAMM|nr:S8 family peptidase [Limnobaculum zhutongyuii]QBH97359.1 S8 family peptidase [Limnobaculum zhutongyuii]TQS90832.1 S8 family peptidase [Limnobaculum zhutongyuii]
MERNLLLGNGDILTSKEEFGKVGGDKNYPYTISDVRSKINSQIDNVVESFSALDRVAKPRGESVFNLTLHPAFLGKSYYPENILRVSGLRDVGSRQITITPRKVTRKTDENKELVTAQLFVSGKEDAVKKFKELLNSNATAKYLQKEFTEIEDVQNFNILDRERNFNLAPKGEAKYEVVLHAGNDDDDIVKAYVSYAALHNVIVDYKNKIQVGGLTFLSAKATQENIRNTLDFALIRVVRPMPILRCTQPNIVRQMSNIELPSLPIEGAYSQSGKVAIFDGGLGTTDLNNWVTEYAYPDTQETVGYLLQHGNEVTSTFLFGRVDKDNPEFNRPFMNVDHYRVLSPESGSNGDWDLFDVLKKIQHVLDTGDYKFANLSLGPRLPIGDDEVHVWTAVLDQICVKHGILLTVAVGNDGEEDGDAGRIQPPSDMVNALAVGAADRSGKKWARAPYSCIGPGRSPGFVKPDGIIFGGSDDEPFYTYNPLLGAIVGVQGTSYASPLALRTAVGVAALSGTPLNTIALKALLVHHAEASRKDPREHIGWGRFTEDPNELIDCKDDTATVIYYGSLAKGKYLRAPIPFPNVPFHESFELSATLCIQTPVDPEHSVNYTRAGMQVSFRPRFGLDDTETDDFFGQKSQYKTERECRNEGHKWETTLHRGKKFNADTLLSDPVFDIRYHARDSSRHVAGKSAPDMQYAMVISVKVKGLDMYNIIRQRYKILNPIQLRTQISIES